MSSQRAPFIWTPRQPIDPSGRRAVREGRPPRDDGKNRFFMFRRSFSLNQAPARAPAAITADGRYILYANGCHVGRGPARCSPLYQRYDEYDLAPLLHSGANTLAVLVHTYGVDTSHYEMVRGLWAPTFGDGALWVEGEVDGVAFNTGAGWRCIQSSAWTQNTPRSHEALGFIEALDARQLPPDWAAPSFDDTGWDEARILISGGGGPEAPFGGAVTKPFPTLLPRGIPALHEGFVRPTRLHWIRGQIPRPSLPIERRLYEEALRPAPDGAVQGAHTLLAATGGVSAHVRTAPGCDIAFLLDFGVILTGRPRIEIEARGGETIEIACAERLPGEWFDEAPAPEARITPSPYHGLDAHLCRYIARPGAQVFEAFERCAIRWMHVVIRDAPAGCRVRALGAVSTHYPVEKRGRFTSSDPFLNTLWSVGAYTVQVCMQDGWEDCPSREQRQWLGDATVENLVAWAAFGPCAAPLNAKFLRQAAESQRPDGLTQMYAPGDHGHDGVLIPDWTLQWILNAADHWMLSGDLETIEAIFPSIQKALAWFERLINANGLVADMPYWHFMDWAALGRDGEACALNAQLAGACRAAAELADALGYARAAAIYRMRAATIARALNTRHWDERRGAYVDVVDPASGVQRPRVSQHANAAMALWCDPPRSRLASALTRITDAARLTFTLAPPVAWRGDPLDEEEGVVLANTFYAHFVYEALARSGRFADALSLMRARYGRMIAQGATTLWESFEPTASLCHGFSASPVHHISRRILGAAPAAPGFAAITVSPDLCGLEHAEGAAPTPRGDVEISLEREDGGVIAHIHAPDAPVTILPPAGWSHVSGARALAPGARGVARFEPKTVRS